MKYNPKKLDLLKSKMTEKVGYVKGVINTDHDKIADIILNGGIVEVRSQEVRKSKECENIQVIELRLYFIPNESELIK